MPLNLTYKSGNNVTITNTETSLAVDGGSTTLQTVTDKGFYTFILRSTAVTKGDEFTWRVYEKASTGATKVKLCDGTISDALPSQMMIPQLVLGIGWDITLQRTGGSNRAFYWSIRRAST